MKLVKSTGSPGAGQPVEERNPGAGEDPVWHQARPTVGGGATILDKYGAVEGIRIPLCSTGPAFVEVELKNSGIQEEENRGSAVQLPVVSSAT